MFIRKIFIICALFSATLFAKNTLAEEKYPLYVNDDEVIAANVEKVSNNEKIKNLLNDLKSQAYADERFKTFLYLTSIAAPSREELYRAKATANLFQEYIDKYKDTSVNAQNARVIYDFDGHMKGAGLQIVDNLPVYNACIEIKGTYEGEGYINPKGENIRPKVLLEGHLDSVNPAHLQNYPNIRNTIMPVHVQPINEPIVNTPEDLAKLPVLKFLDNGMPDESDPVYKEIMKRYKSEDEAKKANAYRIYIPSITDMMLQTTNVVQTAELILKHDIRPVYDLWICGTGGEEGRGNLSGMKQLYGYSQDGIKADGLFDENLKGKGNNALNFVANISTEGNVDIHYLGSHRYQIAYLGEGGKMENAKTIPNPAVAAASAINCISKLKTPDEDKSLASKYSDIKGNPAIKTTYTVGLVYADNNNPYEKGFIPKDVSIEVDMRSNDTNNITIMDRQIKACFQEGLDKVNAKFEKKLTMKERWYGDRPAYVLSADEMANSTMLKAVSYSHEKVHGEKLKLQTPKSAISVNSNVPAKIGVPTVNINYGFKAAGGQGHSFNEWAVLGDAELDTKAMERAIYTLFTLTGLKDADVEPTLAPVGKRDTDELFK